MADVLIDIKRRGEVAEEVHRHHKDVLSLEAIKEFFETYIWSVGPEHCDSKKIIESLSAEITRIFFPFRDIAEAFRLIDSPTTAVFIPYNDEARELADKFRSFEPPNSKDYRAAQRYTVSLYQHDFDKIRPALEDTESGMFILTTAGKYDERLGIIIEDPYKMDSSKTTM